jgi:hypothetical protein
MKKLLVVAVAFALLSSSAFGVGVGFDLGVDYLTASKQYTGSGNLFAVCFDVAADSTVGFVREELQLKRTEDGLVDQDIEISLTGVQVVKAVVDSAKMRVATTVRLGAASLTDVTAGAADQINPWAAVLVTLSTANAGTAGYSANIGVTLGYNWLPVATFTDATPVDVRDLNSFVAGVAVSFRF